MDLKSENCGNNYNKDFSLYLAASNGNLEMVERILKQDGYISYESVESRKSPLIIAIYKGFEDIVKLFLQNGADVNIRNYCGKTGLHIAAGKGNQKMVKLLLENDADVDALDRNGYSPIFYAIEHECEQIVRLLIENGAKVNTRFRDGNAAAFYLDQNRRPPLFHTIERERTDSFFVALSKCRRDVNVLVHYGKTALHVAAGKGNKKIVELLLEKADNVNALNPTGHSPLFYAIEYECEENVKLLLENGANVNARFRGGETGLHRAARKGNHKIAKALLDNAAAVNALDNISIPPLFHAVDRENEELVKLFIESGADVNGIFQNGQTALHVAAWRGYQKVVKLLLENAADVNAVDPSGLSPLYYATRFRRGKTVQLLKEKGARIVTRFSDSKTGLHVAASKKNHKIADIPLGNAAAVNALDRNRRSPLFQAIERESKELAKLFVENEADVNARFHNGKTALHVAAGEGNQKLVELLLENAADVNALDEKGYSPLILATENEFEEIVKLLVLKGADVNARFRDNYGGTALHIAARKGHQKLVELLLENATDMNALDEKGYSPLIFATENELIRDNYGGTALQVAARNGNHKMVELLLKHCELVNVNERDYKLNTALDYSFELENKEITRLLLQNRAAPSALAFAVIKGREKLIELLSKHFPDVTALNSLGVSSLFYAIESEKWNICKLFLEKGATYEIETEQLKETVEIIFSEIDQSENKSISRCMTSLHAAVENDNFKTQLINLVIAQILLEYGADMNIKCDMFGQKESPLVVAHEMLHFCESRVSENIVAGLRTIFTWLKTANLYVGDLELSQTHEMAYKKVCEEEMSRIKIEKVGNSDFFFNDILTKTAHNLAILLKNENINSSLSSFDFNSKFPVYGRVMERLFIKASRRRKLMLLAKANFCHIFPDKMHDCVPKIASYLNELDLLRFWAAF